LFGDDQYQKEGKQIKRDLPRSRIGVNAVLRKPSTQISCSKKFHGLGNGALPQLYL
jgi:hypothetical protein